MATTTTETITTDHGAEFFKALAHVLHRSTSDHLLHLTPGAKIPSPSWYDDPACNFLLAEGERIGAVRRMSTTQVQWTDAGAARHRELVS